MTSKLKQAAVAAVSLSVLFSGQPAHAVMNNPVNDLPNVERPDINPASQPYVHDQAGQPASIFVPPPPAQVSAPQAEQIVQIAEQMQPAVSVSVHVASSAGNTYVAGQCTWYAKSRRPDLPNGLGNGGQWVGHAAALGFSTGSTPRAGAVAEQSGHVAYVESVNADGTVNISEMNYNGGVGVVHQRTVAASTFQYIY